MKKILFLLFTFLFPLSVFAQSEYAMKIKTDSVIYNEDSKILEIPFYFEKDNWERLNPNVLLNDLSCGTDYTWWDESSSSSNYVQFDWKKVKNGLLYATFNFSESSIPWGHKLILRFTNFLGCDFPQWSIKYENEQDYFTWTIPNDKNSIFGCTNPSSPNYDPSATDDDGSCQSAIEGCTDSTALNYNANATIHKESLCQYSQNNTPQDVTGSFEKSQVSIGATTWTLRFNLNVTGATLDPSLIQTWNKFTAVSATTTDKTLTLTLRQFDDQRLDVECTNYEVTIPRRAILTPQGDTNANPITGNFEVVGCEKKPDPQPQENSENTEKKHENTMKQDNLYLSLYDTDENWKIYLNITNVVYFLGLISFFLILFFVLFWYLKNSFVWKSRK